ncbi:hypothetical protein ILUMI_04272 [Ignelater luminosus]|uniref:Tc1-like transposase DDE domain-containing protein n=1 Tax=Ignelater luminosus TaxID=2038154 RepID=A0A8K0DD59_IGNLU|nr:hypothetical protein ILUMI_04272 [Ignelater luminosus]
MSSTDTADEIVEIGLSPPKKRAKKRHFDASTKEMILNIYKCEVNEKPGSTVNDVAIKVANKSGVLEENSVIVLDNAPYHSRKMEKIPTSGWKKSDIQDWLRSNQIKFDDCLLKVELLAIVNEHKKIIDKMAKSQNKIVLRLPPYHCELNPIELIWADMKNYVAEKNTTFKFQDMKTIFFEAVGTITAQKWKNCIQHVQNNIEQKMWDLDNIIEIHVKPLIINVGEDSSTSEWDDESE